MLYGIIAAVTALLLAALLAAPLRGLVPKVRAAGPGRLPRPSPPGAGRAGRRVRPVPPLGGAAVVLATGTVAGVGEWSGVAPLGDGVGGLLLAAAAVALLGLVADVGRLRTRVLVVGTAVAAACVVPYGETGVGAGALAVVWVVCVTLAFRALDHADGLAGTVGVVTAFGTGACAAAELMDGLAVLLSVFAAALTGFLMHNWHPARVGLGACGSLFTGFLLASAAVFARSGHEAGSSAGVLFALFAVAVADALLVVLSRLVAKRPLLRSGPDHLAHRLRRLGLTPQGVTVLAGAGALAGVLAAVLAHTGWAGDGVVLWVVGGVLIGVLVLLRVPVQGARRIEYPQVSARLRVRNG